MLYTRMHVKQLSLQFIHISKVDYDSMSKLKLDLAKAAIVTIFETPLKFLTFM